MDSETKKQYQEYLKNTYVILNDPKKFPESSLPHNGRCAECIDDPFVKLNDFGHSKRKCCIIWQDKWREWQDEWREWQQIKRISGTMFYI